MVHQQGLQSFNREDLHSHGLRGLEDSLANLMEMRTVPQEAISPLVQLVGGQRRTEVSEAYHNKGDGQLLATFYGNVRLLLLSKCESLRVYAEVTAALKGTIDEMIEKYEPSHQLRALGLLHVLKDLHGKPSGQQELMLSEQLKRLVGVEGGQRFWSPVLARCGLTTLLTL